MDISKHPEVFSQFELTKLVGARLLFRNVNLASDNESLEAMNDKQFIEEFSYVTNNMASLWKLPIIPEQTRTMFAEHYGGDGIGRNGGGVRCANNGYFQLKGIGTNHLVGKDTKFSHSNGSLSLLDAVMETIYSEVLHHILPVGTVRCAGILVTGPHKAHCSFSNTNSDNTTIGAILVREKCFRPAHLMRSNFTRNSIDAVGNKYEEFHRLKSLYKRIQPHFARNGGFVSQMNEYLSKHAEQFAFARIARILHGGVTPSNIGIDGKWLDLNTASFIESGINFAMSESSPPFAEEHRVILQIFSELVYTYSKNIGKNVNFSDIKARYIKRYKASLNFHCPWVFGLSREDTQSAIDQELVEVMQNSLSKLLETRSDIETPLRKREKSEDSITSYLTKTFSVAWRGDQCDSLDNLGIVLGHIIRILHENSGKNISLSAFFKSTFLTAYKRAINHPVFCRARMNGILIPLIRNEQYSAITNFITTSISAAGWLFSSSDKSSLCLFDSCGIILYYCQYKDCYELIEPNTNEAHFISGRDAIGFIEGHRDKFYFQNYDFGRGLLESLRFLEELDLE